MDMFGGSPRFRDHEKKAERLISAAFPLAVISQMVLLGLIVYIVYWVVNSWYR